MAGGIWFKEDVSQILSGLTAAAKDRDAEYHAALADVGRSFGLVANGNGLRPAGWDSPRPRREVIIVSQGHEGRDTP